MYTLTDIGTNGVIYKMEFPNGKFYIGQSWNPTRRWSEYKWKHHTVKKMPKLYNALVKYSFDSIKIDIIAIFPTQAELDAAEILYIQQYDSNNNGYNCSLGGNGIKHTDETKRKISEKLTGTKKSEETKKKIGAASKGRPHLKKLAESRKGKKLSQETKDKIRNTLLNRNKTI